MTALIKNWKLGNDLLVEVKDDTVNYYGDYYNVKITIQCRIAVEKKYLQPLKDDPHFEEAVKILGPVVDYRREVVKAGVPGKDLSSTKNHVLETFEKNAIPYFERPDFAERFVRKRFEEIVKDLTKPKPAAGEDGT